MQDDSSIKETCLYLENSDNVSIIDYTADVKVERFSRDPVQASNHLMSITQVTAILRVVITNDDWHTDLKGKKYLEKSDFFQNIDGREWMYYHNAQIFPQKLATEFKSTAQSAGVPRDMIMQIIDTIFIGEEIDTSQSSPCSVM